MAEEMVDRMLCLMMDFAQGKRATPLLREQIPQPVLFVQACWVQG